MRKNFFLIVCLIVLVSFFACTKEGKTPDSGTAGQQKGQISSPSRGSGQQQTSGNLWLRILPDFPTVMEDLVVQADLPAGETAAYEWKRNGQPIVGEHTARLAKNQLSIGDEISVIVKAGTLEGTVTVVIRNNAPRVVSVPFSPENIYAGVDITVTPVGVNPSGDDVKFHYKWSINGKELAEDMPVLKGNSFKRGDEVSLIVIPYDRLGEGEPFKSKAIVIPNAPPRIVSNPPQNIQGDVYSYQVVAEDPDGDPINFLLITSPSGMTIDGKTGMITWPIKDTAAGVYGVEIAVQDPEGRQGTQKYTLTIGTLEGEKK